MAAGMKAEQSKSQPEPVSADQVINYLHANPDFLAEHPQLLEVLELRHATGPAAVSLIERQVEILRGKVMRLEDRLGRLVDAAEDNERRAGNVHVLARQLIRAPTLAGVVMALRKVMKDEFGIEAVFVGVHAPILKRQDISGLTRIDLRSPLHKLYEDFFRTRLIECGPIDEERAAQLFPTTKTRPASAAVVPLGEDKNFGVLALGSQDPKRFAPKQGKLFLEMCAELVTAALKARLA